MTTSIKSRLSEIATKAQAVLDDRTLTVAEKRARLTGMEAEAKTLTDQIAATDQAHLVASGANSAFYSGADASSGFATKSYGGPSLKPSESQVEALHNAARTKQSLRVELHTKSALDLTGSIPPNLAPDIIPFLREPTRVASLFPNSVMAGPSLEYIQHTGNTGAASTVSPGAAKPEIVPNTAIITATARKIAAHIGVNDESLLDFKSTSSYISGELTRAIFSVENQQLLSGNGTAPNLPGILNTTGILTRTQGTSPETPIDTLEMALTDLRTGSSFCEATGFVMNPSDWSAMRLQKSTINDYILGHPTASDGLTLWGKPVVLTTNIAAKTVLVGNFEIGGAVLIRQGMTLETQSAGTDWTSNITRFRAEERIALAIYRPSAFVKVTLS